MILAKDGAVKIKGYNFEIPKETVCFIDSLLESDILGDDIEEKEVMLSTMIKIVKCKMSGKDPFDLIEGMPKKEARALIALITAFNHDNDDDDDEEEDDDVTDFGSGDDHGNVTVICGGKKVVTNADDVGKIIADMVANEIRKGEGEKQ